MEEDRFRRMLESHGRAFTFLPEEIRCFEPIVVEPMVIFTVPVPRPPIPKLMEPIHNAQEERHIVIHT